MRKVYVTICVGLLIVVHSYSAEQKSEGFELSEILPTVLSIDGVLPETSGVLKTYRRQLSGPTKWLFHGLGLFDPTFIAEVAPWLIEQQEMVVFEFDKDGRTYSIGMGDVKDGPPVELQSIRRTANPLVPHAIKSSDGRARNGLVSGVTIRLARKNRVKAIPGQGAWEFPMESPEEWRRNLEKNGAQTVPAFDVKKADVDIEALKYNRGARQWALEKQTLPISEIRKGVKFRTNGPRSKPYFLATQTGEPQAVMIVHDLGDRRKEIVFYKDLLPNARKWGESVPVYEVTDFHLMQSETGPKALQDDTHARHDRTDLPLVFRAEVPLDADFDTALAAVHAGVTSRLEEGIESGFHRACQVLLGFIGLMAGR